MGEIARIVNRYIGVNGYLGDFTYRSHADFYPEFCDLEINPSDFEGTTRERFIAILSSLDPFDQASVVSGVLERFPASDSGPPTRTYNLRDELVRMVQRLRAGGAVPVTHVTSGVVAQAIADAEALLKSSGAASGVDRAHTALHGYLRTACDAEGISVPAQASMNTLLKTLRKSHSKLQAVGPRSSDIERVLNSLATILDCMNPVRNQASFAHPNVDLLEDAEAMLIINTARTLLSYLSTKLD